MTLVRKIVTKWIWSDGGPVQTRTADLFRVRKPDPSGASSHATMLLILRDSRLSICRRRNDCPAPTLPKFSTLSARQVNSNQQQRKRPLQESRCRPAKLPACKALARGYHSRRISETIRSLPRTHPRLA